MSSLDPLGEPLARLFLRLDAAYPTAERLNRIAAVWQRARGGAIAPGAGMLADIPETLRAHCFTARLTRNGTEHWVASDTGAIAASILELKDGAPLEESRMRSAVRLRKLFELVAERAEPYAGVFEDKAEDSTTNLIEVYVAPLAAASKTAHTLLGAVSSRVENM